MKTGPGASKNNHGGGEAPINQTGTGAGHFEHDTFYFLKTEKHIIV